MRNLLPLLIVMMAAPAFAADPCVDANGRAICGDFGKPGSISSTHRGGVSKPDPMLNTNMPSPSSAISATSVTSPDMKIDPRACEMLTKHTASADVNVQPGVDVNGKAVAPADVPGQPQMQLPDKLDIPLTISLAKVLNLDTSKAPFNTLGTGTEIQLGSLQLEGDRVFYNGKPLSDQQQDNLAVLCMKQK